MNAVLLDTSFLISLSDPDRPHHGAAVQYYKECIRLRVRMMLSTIVVSEFQVRQSIKDLQLRNFIVLPFNVDHAMACGLLVKNFPRDDGDDRVRVKDDMKLLAQCECDAIDHLLTEDASTLTKYAARVSETLQPDVRSRAEEFSDGDSGRSQVASIFRELIPADWLHPRVAWTHCRPMGARGSLFGERPV